jgi:hypothetical protein
MSWLLSRTDYRADGIFGELYDDSEEFCVTLEHAYVQPDGSYEPKLPNGTYTCVRGTHTLEHWNKGQPFEAFEVTGVPGHTGILFHVGNKNADSDGCILIAQKLIQTAPFWIIQSSLVMFEKFMTEMEGINEFELVVA